MKTQQAMLKQLKSTKKALKMLEEGVQNLDTIDVSLSWTVTECYTLRDRAREYQKELTRKGLK